MTDKKDNEIIEKIIVDRKYTNELTQSTITNLIDKIVIFPSEIIIEDGKKVKILKREWYIKKKQIYQEKKLKKSA